MTGELVSRDAHAPVVIGANDGQVSDLAAEWLDESVRPNTRRARERAIRKFAAWCDNHGRVALPATGATLTSYVADLMAQDYSPGTIEQQMGLIRGWHKRNGHEGQPGTVDAIDLLNLHRYRRAERGQRVRKAPPLLAEDVAAIVEALNLDTVAGRRDQVALVFGFMMMARRSELVALRFGEITETRDGLDVLVRTSKTDKQSEGQTRSLPLQSYRELCPVRVLESWREALGDPEPDPMRPLLCRLKRNGMPGGPLTADAVNDIVKRGARAAGLLNPDSYSAHSLRSGGITSAVDKGKPLSHAARHGGWAEGSPVPNTYIRTVDRWKQNPMRGVF